MPADGSLPEAALAEFGSQPFGLYVHVPFCTVRCGYCDFNTYTAEELGDAPGASRATYAEAVIHEIRHARRVLGDRDVPIDTIFFGGGTPTLLKPADLGAVIASAAAEFGLAGRRRDHHRGQPRQRDRVGPRASCAPPASTGSASACSPPSTTCSRCSTARTTRSGSRRRSTGPGPPGFDEVSLDLIYGTPGESVADWETSLEAALACEPDHVSAYSLIVEDGTALARRVRRGELPMPDEDDLADKYDLADERLTAAGLEWYEVSNWARRPESRCRHNVLYWTGGHWWGAGPGAHSHVGGVRWWNVKHPAAYADRLAAGTSPALAYEHLSEDDRRLERILLELRLRDGLPVLALDRHGRAQVARLVEEGLVTLGDRAADPDPARTAARRRGRARPDLRDRRRRSQESVRSASRSTFC